MSDVGTNLQSMTGAPARPSEDGSLDGVEPDLLQSPMAYVDRDRPLRPNNGASETDVEFYTRREQEELAIAMSAADQVVRDIHNTLANEYRAKLEQLTPRRTG